MRIKSGREFRSNVGTGRRQIKWRMPAADTISIYVYDESETIADAVKVDKNGETDFTADGTMTIYIEPDFVYVPVAGLESTVIHVSK